MKHEEELKFESENNHVTGGLYHDISGAQCGLPTSNT